MKIRYFLKIAAAGAILALVSGCEEIPQQVASVAAAVIPTTSPMGWWEGDGVPGPSKIVVNIAEQKARFFKGGRLVGETTVSTGKQGFGTPPGHYRVVSKDADHVSSEFGDYVDDLGNVVRSNVDARKDRRPPGSHFSGAKMPYCMHFNGGYAMHQGYVPPFAASHGCIRVPQGMAEHFFDAATEGTPILVKSQ